MSDPQAFDASGSDASDGDPQDVAEALDWDKVEDDQDYEGEESLEDYPPEQPLGVDGMAMTPAEEAFPESAADREARTVPDTVVEELLRTQEAVGLRRGALADRQDDEEDLAMEGEEVPDGRAWPEGGGVAGLTATTPLEDDDEATMIASAADNPGEVPAEEAALHPTGPPPYRDDDSYLEER